MTLTVYMNQEKKWNCVDTSIWDLQDYKKKSKERLIKESSNSINNIMTNRTSITRKQKWEEKQLYEVFKRQTSDIAHMDMVKNEHLTKETEFLLNAASKDVIWTEYEVHTISFQTFFGWVFKIVVHSSKFSMLLLYILWDDWPMFMISGLNEHL